MNLARGTTRIVLLTRAHAIKLPYFGNGWALGLRGLLANLQETMMSATGWPELCPVRWSFPGGWLVVMHRAEPLTDQEWDEFDADGFRQQHDYVVPTETKRSSFGTFGGRIVSVDYG